MTSAVLQFLPEAAAEAERLAERLGIPAYAIGVHRFPDGELRVSVGPAAATTLLYIPLHNPNEKLIALLFAAEALRRGDARRLVLVAPYLCYMRQDAAFNAGEAISQRAIGSLIARTVDRVVTIDAHLHRTQRIQDVFPGIEAENVSAMPAIADTLRSDIDSRTVVVGPDEESRSWVEDLAGRLHLAFTIARKLRRSDRSVEIAIAQTEKLTGRPALVVDDIVSSGGTLIACAQTVRRAGATSVDAIITHALFPPQMLHDFSRAGMNSVRSTTSVPHPTNAIPLDGVLAQALRSEVTA